MYWTNVTWMLTGLGAVVVLLTRVRLGGAARRRTSGAANVSAILVSLHTGIGVVALVLWVVALVTAHEVVTFVALMAWWALAIVGLMLLARWLPSGGRHAEEKIGDAWGSGAGLSALGHLGMVIGVCFFTFVTLTGRLW